MSKLAKLKRMLREMGSVVIAYSGGLDSTFLLKVAVDTLGRKNVLAVTARSETYPSSEYREAKRLAKKIGARHRTITTAELGIKNFKENPINRCYYCKRELFKKLTALKSRADLFAVLDGTNYDDLKDVRHGRKAAQELGVRSPLLEAGIGKALIRSHSKRLGLDTWDKPSFACLASRIPFNSRIRRADLERVDKAEALLRKTGFGQVRVRVHGEIARLEFYRRDFPKVLDSALCRKVVAGLKRLGFAYITLDLEGYRTGSMHEAVLTKS